MTISPARLANAKAAFFMGCSEDIDRRIEQMCKADDAFRASHPDVPEEEPDLPDYIHYDQARNCYYHNMLDDAVPGGFRGDDLRAIANFQDWKSRAAEREATATKANADDIISSLRQFTREDQLRIAQAVNVHVQDYEAAMKARNLRVDEAAETVESLIKTLQAALDAQRKAGGK